MRKKTTKKTMTEEEARAVLTGYGCICGKCKIACVQAFYSDGLPELKKKKGFQVFAKCQSEATAGGRKISTKDDFCSCCSHFVPIEKEKPDPSDPKDTKQEEKK
jgi:hypothetical protein